MKKWALVSVFDKTGVVEFCTALVAAEYGILSTGGTAETLKQAGLPVTTVEDYTGFPEMMGGRVKTLHPLVHGGLLGIRGDETHRQSMETHGIYDIAVVVVNLYPFEQTIARPDVTFEQAVEMIDIGGPSMLRSAAKNHRDVIPVVDPADYAWIAQRIETAEDLSAMERTALATKVFATTHAYDGAISKFLETFATSPVQTDDTWPDRYTVSFQRKQTLRYGENPHQKAQFFVSENASPASIARAEQLQGKELSYNNIQDADAAIRILRELDDLHSAAVVAVKHMNPCGVGLGGDIDEAFERAYEADPVSIFGGIVACNRPVDKALAERLTGMFLEIVIGPGFTEGALQQFAKKKNVRLLTIDLAQPLWRPGEHQFRRVSGGLLVQDVDAPTGELNWQVVTQRVPTTEEAMALRFSWKIVKHVKSNAIVLATDTSTLGIGAGQMNRVGAAQIAIAQAGVKAVGSALASDAFFPMRDTVDAAAAAGVGAIIQPGGSIKDADSIAAADAHGIAMVFTGVRHFLH